MLTSKTGCIRRICVHTRNVFFPSVEFGGPPKGRGVLTSRYSEPKASFGRHVRRCISSSSSSFIDNWESYILSSCVM